MPNLVKSAALDFILKVKEFCEAEQRNHGLLIPINNIHQRVSAMTGTFLGLLTCQFYHHN